MGISPALLKREEDAKRHAEIMGHHEYSDTCSCGNCHTWLINEIYREACLLTAEIARGVVREYFYGSKK
jgi:hypothetical protein